MNAALDYAENTLGVHKVFEEALAFEKELDEITTALDKAQDARRDLDAQIEDREMNLLIEERGKHPDHSQAAFDRHLKEVYFKDDTLKRLKMSRDAKSGEVNGLQLDHDFIKQRMRVRAARMEELGGYFSFLAVTKQAELAQSQQQ